MISILIELARNYREEQMGRAPQIERIQIGDLSQRGGGKMTRHASHQNGLDVDVVYFRNDLRETFPVRGALANFDESFVEGNRLTKNFDSVRTGWVFRRLVQTGKVDRIFVDPAVKQFYCENRSQLGAVNQSEEEFILSRIRPYPHHSDHFHVRIKCPIQDSKCIASPELPGESGCDSKFWNQVDETP
jgi:penicillin-insensitive murein endopeptidase